MDCGIEDAIRGARDVILALWVSLLDSLPVEFLIWGFVLLLLVVPIVFPR
jgi:hypothetical protein